MDQRFRIAGSLSSAIILIVVSLIFFLLAAGMFAAYPDSIWLVGLFFLVCGAAIVYGAIKSIITATRENKAAEQIKEQVVQQVTRTADTKGQSQQLTTTTVSSEAITATIENAALLACWNYSLPEWEAFMRLETKSLRERLLIQSLLIVVLGTVVVLFSTNASLLGAAAASIFTGAVYGLLKYNFHVHSIHHKGPGNPVVLILPDALIINGHYNALKGENLWFENAVIKKEKQCSVLEITYGWSTRRGNTNDEIRVPVPPGKENEAVRIVKELKSRHSDTAERKVV